MHDFDSIWPPFHNSYTYYLYLKPINFFDKIKLHNFVSTSWKLHSLTLIHRQVWRTDLFLLFLHTSFGLFNDVSQYINYLEQQWQLYMLLALLVAGWGWTSYTVQRNNSIGKWMIHKHHPTLQWHRCLHAFPT